MSLRIRRCNFCGKEIPKGFGLMYVKSDGTVLHFCSSKCKKSMLVLKRKPHKIRWIRKSKKSS